MSTLPNTKEEILNEYESFHCGEDGLDETHYYRDNVLMAMEQYANEKANAVLQEAVDKLQEKVDAYKNEKEIYKNKDYTSLHDAEAVVLVIKKLNSRIYESEGIIDYLKSLQVI